MMKCPHSTARGCLLALCFLACALCPAASLSPDLEPTAILPAGPQELDEGQTLMTDGHLAQRTGRPPDAPGAAASSHGRRAGAGDGRRNEDSSRSQTTVATEAEVSATPKGTTSTQRRPGEDKSRDAESAGPSPGGQQQRAFEDQDKDTSAWASNDDVTNPSVDYRDYEELGDDFEDDAFDKKELSTASVSAGQDTRDGQRQEPRDGQGQDTRDGQGQEPRDGQGQEPRDGQGQEPRDGQGQEPESRRNLSLEGARAQPRDEASGEREKPKDGETASSGQPRDSVKTAGIKDQDESSNSDVTDPKYEKVKSRNRPKWLSRPSAGQGRQTGDGESLARMRYTGPPAANGKFDSVSPLAAHVLRDHLTTRQTDSLTPDLTTQEADSHIQRGDHEEGVENSFNIRPDLAVTPGLQGLPGQDDHQQHHHDSAQAKSAANNNSEPRDDKWSAVKQKKPAYVKGCPDCERFDAGITEARNLRLQVLRGQLLDKLRMVPRFKSSPWPPKLPDQVFPDYLQQDQSDADSKYYARTTEVIVFGRDLDRHRLRRDGTGSYQFGVTGKVKGGLASAELWIYKMSDANDVHGQTLIVTELNFRKGRHLQERSLVARAETRVQEGWISFDVTRLVQRWEQTKPPASNQLLAIRCKTCTRTNYRAIFGAKSNFRPVLVMHIQSAEEYYRTQRSTCDPHFDCCKFDLFVHFRDLGIHEVFYPRSIKADYCYGSCDRPDMGYYRHSQLMQNFRWNNDRPVNSTLRERLKPCCVPVVLRQTSIMYYTNNGLDTEVSVVPNILVDKCGCA